MGKKVSPLLVQQEQEQGSTLQANSSVQTTALWGECHSTEDSEGLLCVRGFICIVTLDHPVLEKLNPNLRQRNGSMRCGLPCSLS